MPRPRSFNANTSGARTSSEYQSRSIGAAIVNRVTRLQCDPRVYVAAVHPGVMAISCTEARSSPHRAGREEGKNGGSLTIMHANRLPAFSPKRNPYNFAKPSALLSPPRFFTMFSCGAYANCKRSSLQGVYGELLAKSWSRRVIARSLGMDFLWNCCSFTVHRFFCSIKVWFMALRVRRNH